MAELERLSNFKIACWEAVKRLISEKMKFALLEMEEAQKAANAEGKSSMGDKYETGRAMSQNQRDMYAKQMTEHQHLLNKISDWENQIAGKTSKRGSLVKWNEMWYLIGPGLGLCKTDSGDSFFAVSVLSPIGSVLLGKNAGETLEFQGKKAKLELIL